MLSTQRFERRNVRGQLLPAASGGWHRKGRFVQGMLWRRSDGEAYPNRGTFPIRANDRAESAIAAPCSGKARTTRHRSRIVLVPKDSPILLILSSLLRNARRADFVL